MAEELGEVAENGAIASDKYRYTSERGDNITEATEKFENIDSGKNPGIKEIQENLVIQKSNNTAELNKDAKTYQDSEDKFHNTLSNTIETQTGTKILENDMGNAVKKYKPGERTGEPKQDVVNETLDNATQDLKDNLPADKKKFSQKVAGRIGKTLIVGSIISGIIFDVIRNKDKTLDEIVQGAAGCYQKITDDKGVVYYVGPCKCGFDLKNNLVGTCTEYDANNKIADQIKNSAFCQTSTFSNLKTPCLISKIACKSINNGGNCQDGTCDNKNCKSNPNSPACQWKNDKGNVNVESFAFCGNSSDIMMKMIVLSNNSDQWAPQPPPPITVAISIIGGLIILITVVWYILLLIRKERKMGKK